jgi:hypothetical protein
MVHLDFKATNNMAEYEALTFRLSTSLSLGDRQLLVKGDNQLVIKQVKGECSCHDVQLAAYLLHVQKLEKDFEILDLQHVPLPTMQSPMSYQQRSPPGGLRCPTGSSSGNCSDMQPGLPNRAKGARLAPRIWRSRWP